MQIRISSEALRSGAERHRTILTAIDDAASNLNAQIPYLRQAWEGAAGMQAVETLEGIKKFADSLTEATGYGASKLTGFCEALEALDLGEQIGFISRRLDITRFTQHIGTARFPFYQPGSIRIVPEELYNIAEQNRSIADTYSGRADDLQNSLYILQNEWEGNAFNRFFEETTELIDGYRRMYEEILEFSDRLHDAAARYEEIDNMF